MPMFFFNTSLIFLKNNSSLKIFTFLPIPMIMTSLIIMKIPIYNQPQNNCSYDFMLDTFAWAMVFLTILLLFFTNFFFFYSSNNHYSNMSSLSFFLCFICIVTFISKFLMMFFIFFELSLIPIFLIIFGWGYQPERMNAGKMMLFYTLFGSMPFLIFIAMFYNSNFFSFIMMQINYSNLYNPSVLILSMLLLILKLPLFGFHLWLPAAHVEAPAQGSILLAGILLKLGSFGIWRILSIFSFSQLLSNKILLAITMFGLMASVLSIISQTDMKIIIAYSSVAHMTIAFLGMLIQFNLSMSGAMMMFIGHTIISANMFLMAAIYYSSSNSRIIFLNKGFLKIQASMMLFWAITCIFNAGGPFTLSLLSEIMLIMSSFFSHPMAIIPIFLFLMLGMMYNISIYTKISHSNMNKLVFITFNKMMYANSMFYILFMILSTLSMFLYFL